MRHRVGVPPLREHRDGDHAPGLSSQPARLADRVHDLAKEVLIREVLSLGTVASPLHDLAAEPLDLVSCRVPEGSVQCVPGFELFAVDEEGAGTRERVAQLVEVSEKCEAALFERFRAIVVLAMEPGDVVVDQLRRRGVVAHDDEARWCLDLRVTPQLERLGVVTVESFKGGLELDRDAERVERRSLAPAPLRHLLPDVMPQVPEPRHVLAGDVVRDGNPRQLHDPALDGVHERKVAHRPREEGAFGVPRATKEEGRCREIDHPCDADLLLDGLQSRDPHPRGFSVLLRFFAIVALELAFLVLARGPLAVAVVGLVVEDEDLLHAH